MANSPAEGIKDLLAAEAAGTFAATTGWGIFIGREPLQPDTAITVYDTGGLQPNPKWLLDWPSVQIRVRGAKGAYQAAYNKVKQCQDIVLGIDSQDLNGDRWVSVTGLGSILWLGHDDNERPQFVANYRLIIQPAVSAETKRTAL